MKSTTKFSALILVFAMVLASCGGDEEPADTTAGDATSETTAAASETTASETTSSETAASETTSSETTAPAETSAPAETAAAVEPASVTFVTGAASIAPKEEVAAYAVPKALGYFEEEGLTVDLITADGSTASLQAIASGSATFSSAGGGPILAAVSTDVPVQAVGGLVVNWPWRMGVLPDSDIEAPEDLLGSNIGIISLASGSNPYARAFIAGAGGDPDADASYVPVGLGPSAAAALTDGQVDTLALFTQAFASMENAGLELRYLENPDVFNPLFSLTWAVTDDFLAESPDVATRFLRAAYKGLLFSHANPEAAMRIGYEEFPELLGDETDPEARIDADTAVLESWLITTAPAEGDPASWGDWGALSDEDWAAVEEFTINAGTIDEPVPRDEVWTPDLLEEANNWDRQEVLDDAANYQPTG